jgi:6-phosphogluconate dehydrogenase (decarboxylating)
MSFGIVGLGRMGSNIARHATEKGHWVVGFDPSEATRTKMASAMVAAGLVSVILFPMFALTVLRRDQPAPA